MKKNCLELIIKKIRLQKACPNMYCTARYGFQARQLDTTLSDKINVEWRTGIAGLPGQTVGVLHPGLARNESVHIQRERRVYKPFYTMLFG